MKVTIDKGVKYRWFLPDDDLFSAVTLVKTKPTDRLGMYITGYGKTEEDAVDDMIAKIKEWRTKEYPKEIEMEDV